MDEVVVEYRLTWNEWRRIYWGASAKNVVTAFVAFFVFFFGLAAAVFIDQSRVWAIVVSIFALGYVVSNFWIAPRRYWNSAAGVREAQLVQVTDEGILRTSESLDEHFDWDRFRGLKDTNGFFIVVGRPGSASVFLPKRGLATTHDEATLRRVILRHLPNS